MEMVVLYIFIVSSTETRQTAIHGYQVQQKFVPTMAGDKPQYELYEEESRKFSTLWRHVASSIN
jgi:hypothetical protein